MKKVQSRAWRSKLSDLNAAYMSLMTLLICEDIDVAEC